MARDLDPAGERIVRREEVGRVLGDEADHPGQRIAAVQRRRRAAQDLDLLEQVDIHRVAAGTGEAADGEGIGDRNAIDLDRHAVAAEPADREASETEARSLVAYADAGFVAHQVADVMHVAPIDFVAVDHRHGGCDFGGGLFGLAGHHHEGIECLWCVRPAGRRGGEGKGGTEKGGCHRQHTTRHEHLQPGIEEIGLAEPGAGGADGRLARCE